MQDLTLVQLKQAYDAALEQIAAESFLQKGMPLDLFIARLQLGNNPIDADPTKPDLIGKLCMTQSQAEAFVSRYQIIDARPDDATGFSAVALRDTKGDDDPTNDEVIIAVRSTEFNLDRPRDVATDIQIEQTGFAFEQILSMQAFMDRVLTQIPAGAPVSLVGYSLSGNVVRTIAAMLPDQVSQVDGSNIVFNPTGLGDFQERSGYTGPTRTRAEILQDMMTTYQDALIVSSTLTTSVIADYLATLDPSFPPDQDLLQLYENAKTASVIDRTDPTQNVYGTARTNFAEAVTSRIFNTSYSTFGTTAPESAFTQFFGHALSGFDGEAVANSGIHPDPIAIPIEGQPLIEVTTPRFDFLNTHSLTLVTDSLRLLILFKEVAPSVTMDDLQTILQASSAESAGIANSVEADTLEKALDGLRKVFLPADPNFQPTPSNQTPSGFGDLDKRTVYYTNIAAVENALPDPRDFSVQSLAGAPAAGLLLNANGNDSIGLAYRFALRELNPFAVIGFDYAQHNVDGALEVLAPDTAAGQLTTQYLEDRADFLAKKLEVNTANGGVLVGLTNFFNDTHFMDVRTKDEIQAGLFSTITGQREFLFDDDEGHPLTGGSKADHLYGAGGDDTLIGNGGNDYLEGDAGNDLLEGGAGFDTYVYRLSDNLDTINDSDGRGRILYDTHAVDGGIRTATDQANTYHGGAQGAMTYVWEGTTLTINNLITVQDFQNGNLGIHLTTAPDATIAELPPPPSPTRTEQTIDFSNSLQQRTDYFQGIHGAFYYPPPPVEFNDENNQYWYVFDLQDENGLISTRQPAGYLSIHAQGGDDHIEGGPGADQLFGDGGNDFLDGSTGNDQLWGGVGEDGLEGEDGNDQLVGGADADFLWGDGGIFRLLLTGDDSLDGGDGDDALMGGRGADFLLGGLGSDQLFGDGPWDPRPGGDFWEPSNDGPDWLEGGDGNDLLESGGGDDVLLGDKGNDVLVGDYAPNSIRRLVFEGTINQYVYQGYIDGSIGGQDWLDGGEGDDFLWGGRGNDTLLGGEGNDALIGDYSAASLDAAGIDGFAEGDDYLDGGAGDDVLSGDGGNDTLLGRADNDTLDGGSGDDLLDGGGGNDVLIGGAGTNTILFGRGSDHDTVNDAGNVQATDIIRFADGISPEDVTIRLDANFDLALSITGATDQITVSGFFSNSFSPVIQAAFADGTVWGAATLTALDSVGTHGTEVDDVMIVGPGNKTLLGGRGNDTYVLNLGDGTSTIIDTAAAGEGNVVAFGGAITSDSLSLGLGSLLIKYGTQGDEIHIKNFDPSNALGSHAIDTFQFVDGTVLSYSDLIGRGFDLTGTDGDDVIIGTNVVDRIVSLEGSDTLSGGASDDTYVFNLGDGVDTIHDVSAMGEGNSIQFGAGITAAGLTFTRDRDNHVLTITCGAGGDAIQLAGFDPNNRNGSLVVSALHFVDGSSITMSELFPQGATMLGTDGDEVFIGTPGDDVIDARGGADQLDGGSGDDILTGGAGDDELAGGAGNDVLIGDGIASDPGGGPPPPPPLPGGDLPGPPGDGFPDPGGGLPDPGGVLPIGGDPPVVGGNDRLDGGDGEDLLQAGDGNDRLDGGAGVDMLIGGSGDDLYVVDNVGDAVVEAADEGQDTVLSAVSYVLGDHVEHLTLTGTVTYNGAGLPISGAVSATGNALDNQLTGNSGRNILDGGPGADLLAGGQGNDTYMVDDAGDVVIEAAGEGGDQVYSAVSFALPDHVESLTLTGEDAVGGSGNAQNNVLRGNSAANVLDGGAGNDWVGGGAGDDTYLFNRGGGQDRVSDSDATAGNTDRLVFGVNIAPLDLIISRHVNDLKVALHGSSDQITVQNWYGSPNNQTEVSQAGNGQQLLNTQVDQLIQAMAQFSAENGMTWDQAIDQRPQDVQTILAASWQ